MSTVNYDFVEWEVHRLMSVKIVFFIRGVANAVDYIRPLPDLLQQLLLLLVEDLHWQELEQRPLQPF